jgi:hypothetical protein
MLSSDAPLVRGPKMPIVPMTTTMAPAMNENAPMTPNSLSIKAMKKELKTADMRLHE